MDITIIYSNASKGFFDNFLVQWELNFAKNRRKYVFAYAMYAVIVLLGVVELFKEERPDRLLDFPMGTFLMTLGGVMLYVTFYYHRYASKLKKENIHHASQIADQLKKGENQQVIRLKDDGLYNEQHKISEYIGWEYFSHYSIHEDLLILHQNVRVIQNYVIRRSHVTPTEYEEILAFVQGRLKEHVY